MASASIKQILAPTYFVAPHFVAPQIRGVQVGASIKQIDSSSLRVSYDCINDIPMQNNSGTSVGFTLTKSSPWDGLKPIPRDGKVVIHIPPL